MDPDRDSAPTPTAPTPAREPSGSATAPADPARGVPPYDAGLGVVGPYRIVGVLGEGGMGTVYLAEQDAPVRREVALKLLRPGVSRTDVLARFETERQALALMEHPNITRVYDAGATAAGEPYFVMERVNGVTITAYGDAHALTVRERVRLFTQVCAAVQHAHQKGIIHRDLKPSNVLVTEVDGAPQCKVIDFGVAKAVTPGADDPPLTATGVAIGTPAYMSPEQFAADPLDVDTRSDVYSLGVLLYELLTGVRPFDAFGAGLGLWQATQEVPPPSARFAGLAPAEQATRARSRGTEGGALRQALAGDLDAVLLKALERDRDRRYATANDLAQDLSRYLRDEPVTATQATRAYRLRKFVRRHRIGVAFSGVLLALLVVFAVTAAEQARRLAAARRIAVARQAQAERLVGFMLGDLQEKLAPIGRLDVLDAAGAAALAYFATVPEAELSNEELARRSMALQQLGQVRIHQDRLPEAAALFAQAVAAGERLAARGPLTPEHQLTRAHARFWAGNAHWKQGNVDSALVHFVPFATATEALVAQHPDSATYRRELAYALSNIGSASEARGDVAGALAAYRRVLALRQALLARTPDDPVARRDVALAHNVIGVAERRAGSLDTSAAHHRAEIALYTTILNADPVDAAPRRTLAAAHLFLAQTLLARGAVGEAVEAGRAAHAGFTALTARDPANATWRTDLAAADNLLAQLFLARGDAAAALRAADAAARTVTGAAGPTRTERVTRIQIIAGTARARALVRAGRPGDAIAAARAAAALGDSAVARKPADLDHRRAAGEAYLALGEVLGATGDAPGSRRAREQALGVVDSVAIATAHTELLAVAASALLDLGHTGPARQLATRLAQRGYRHPAFVARLGAPDPRTRVGARS